MLHAPIHHGNKRRHRGIVWSAILFGLPALLYATAPRAPERPSWAETFILATTGPLSGGLHAARNATATGWRHALAVRHALADNDRLTKRVAELEMQLAAWHEVGQENHRLRQLLELPLSEPVPRRVAAQVVAHSPLATFQTIRLNRGSRHGVKRGDAVVSAEGVVGRLVNVAGAYADAILLIDASASLDTVVQRSRARVRLRGRGKQTSYELDTQYLARTVDLVPGDLLVTSGLGQTLPKGVPVGFVRAVERPAYGLYQQAVVQPTVNFAELEDVLIVAIDAPLTEVGRADP